MKSHAEPVSEALSGVDPLTGMLEARTADNASPLADTFDDSGRWERRGEVGAGGMGLVAIFYDRRLGRELAVKTPVSPQDTQRLAREALVTARLEHPGIVAIYDTGTSPSGAPWFAMRLVRGSSLASIISASKTAAERLGYLRHVQAAAEAVAYAHSRGVVHRDLKPANIMVGAFGETQVIDWGLALAPDVPSVDPGRAGTPSSMSPEQARGEPIDARTDVYGLGAILRQVLTGRTVFGPESDREATFGALAANRVPAMPEDDTPPALRAIVERAMAPRAQDRYPDAKAFADDLGRFLDGRRVIAHSYTPLELVRRLVRVWRLPLLVAAAGLVVLAIVLVVAFSRITAERDLSDDRLAVTLVGEARRAIAADSRGLAEVLAREAFAHAPVEARGILMALPAERPTRQRLGPLDCEATDVAVVAGAVRVLCHSRTRISVHESGAELWGQSLEAATAVMVERGEMVLVRRDIGLEILDARTGRHLATRPSKSSPTQVVGAADGVSALTFGGSFAALVRAGSVAEIPIGGCHGSRIRAAALAHDGDHWTLVCADGALVVGRLSDAAEERFETGFPVSPQAPLPTVVAFETPDRLLVGDDAGHLIRVDLAAPNGGPSGRQSLVIGRGLVRSITVSPDLSQAVVLADSEPARVIDLARWASLGRLPALRSSRRPRFVYDRDGGLIVAHEAVERWDFRGSCPRELVLPMGISTLSVSPDGRYLGAGWGSSLALIDAERREVVATHSWQSDFVKASAFGPGNVLTGAGMGTVGAARFDPKHLASPYQTDRSLRRIAVLADGTALALDYGSFLLHLSPTRPAIKLARYDGLDLATSPDGRRAVVLGADQRLSHALDLHLGKPLEPLAIDFTAIDVTVDDRGHVRAASPDGIRQWFEGVEGPGLSAVGADLIAVAAAGDLIAASSKDGTVYVWRAAAPDKPWAKLRAHEVRADTLVVEPHGRWIASGGWDGQVQFLRPPDHIEERPTSEAEAWWGVSLTEVLRSP